MTCFTITVVFFLLAQCATSYARGIRIYAPFSDPNTATTFTKTFVSNIAGCGEFGSQEAEDFDDIIQSLIQTQNIFNGRHDNSKRAKAMQIALAASIAEMIVEESEGRDLQQKTNAAIDALKNAFMSTTGQVDEGFIREIIELVNMFSQEPFNEIDNRSSGRYYQYSTGGGQGGAQTITETITINAGGGGGDRQTTGAGGIGTYRPVTAAPYRTGGSGGAGVAPPGGSGSAGGTGGAYEPGTGGALGAFRDAGEVRGGSVAPSSGAGSQPVVENIRVSGGPSGGSSGASGGQTYYGSSSLPSLVNGLLSSLQPFGFNYQNFGKVLSQYLTGSGACNSNDVNVLMDAIMAALHCLSYGSGSVPSTPPYSSTSAYNQSIRRMFTF